MVKTYFFWSCQAEISQGFFPPFIRFCLTFGNTQKIKVRDQNTGLNLNFSDIKF